MILIENNLDYKILNECEMHGFKVISTQKILSEEDRKRTDYICFKKAVEAKNKKD